MPAAIDHREVAAGIHHIGPDRIRPDLIRPELIRPDRLVLPAFDGEGAFAQGHDLLRAAVGGEVLDAGIGAGRGAIQHRGNLHVAYLQAVQAPRVAALLRGHARAAANVAAPPSRAERRASGTWVTGWRSGGAARTDNGWLAPSQPLVYGSGEFPGETRMKAVGYTHCHPVTHEDALLDLVLPVPAAPRGHDILIEVRAVSVNPVDAKPAATLSMFCSAMPICRYRRGWAFSKMSPLVELPTSASTMTIRLSVFAMSVTVSPKTSR